MGGIGSGSYLRSDAKGVLEHTKCIDIRYLRRNGFLKVGYSSILSWSFRGHPRGSIGYTSTADSLELSYRIKTHGGDWESVEQRIRYDFTPCNYGGTRQWFICSHCNRRCEVLCSSDKYFICRLCARLSYRTQHEGYLDRLYSKKHKLQERLWGKKRRRMLSLTRFKLEHEFYRISDITNQAMLDMLKRL